FSAVAETVSSPAQPLKSIVGQDLSSLGETAGSTAKSAMYFFAILLCGLGLWKHFLQKKGGTESSMRVISRTSVGPRAALVLAEVEGRRFLLSQSPDRLSLISELSLAAAPFHEVLSEELEAVNET